MSRLPNSLHSKWLTFIVVKNEALDPIDVCLLGAKTVMLAPDHVTNLIEQFWFVRLWAIAYTS